MLKKLIQRRLPTFFWLTENCKEVSRNSFDGFVGDFIEMNLKTKLRGIQNNTTFRNGINCFNIYFKNEAERKFHSLQEFIKGLDDS